VSALLSYLSLHAALTIYGLHVRLLCHEAAAYVGVVRDGDLEVLLAAGQVIALLAFLGVLQGVEGTGRQGGDGLRSDQHACVLDDEDHLTATAGLVRADVAARGGSDREGKRARGDAVEP